MTENTPDRSPDDTMDPDKEARMLLNPPTESVQFSQNASPTNGQVVLPINNRASSGVGMTKQELMKYANDPFWIRLRMFLFILFWVVWLAMLVGAVVIIMLAPGCPATASLPWWKKCALVQVSVKSEGNSLTEKVTSANENLKALKANLDTLKEANLDGFLLTGLDTFLLDTSNNATLAEVEKFRSALSGLVEEMHGENVKGKLIIGLNLSETHTSHSWFVESQRNGSAFTGFYLWTDQSPANVSLSWDYSPDRYKYYGRRSEKHAVLNYGNTDMRERMHTIVLDWVRTKLDGIQIDGDLWAEDAEGRVHLSKDATLQVHKWVKTGGENKAFIVADSKLAPELVKQGEDEASFELSPESSLWKELIKSAELKDGLTNVFAHYVQLDKSAQEAAAQNTTAKDGTVAPKAGDGWRAFTVPFHLNDQNPITSKQGLAISEGVLISFYLLPKSTPIVQVEGAEQLAKVKSNKLLRKLDDLRRDQSETLMLGSTQLPEVSSREVFAVARSYKDKNSYLLLINFGTTSQEVSVKGAFPDPATHTSRILLTDSQSPASLVGQDVNLSKLQLQPKSVLLVEFALKE